MRRLIISVLATCLVTVLVPTSASASAFRLRVEDMSTGLYGYGVVVTDDLGLDADPTDGIINVTSTFVLSPEILLTITTGMSKPETPFPGTGVYSHLNLNSVSISSTGAANVRITLEDTGYTAGTGMGPLALTNTIGGTLTAAVGTTLTTQAWASSANAVPALGGDTLSGPANLAAIGANVGDVTTGSQTFSDAAFFDSQTQAFGGFAAGSSYSLFTQAMVAFGGAGNVSFNQATSIAETSALVPEPSTLLLLGTGLAGLAVRSRRRRGRASEAPAAA